MNLADPVHEQELRQTDLGLSRSRVDSTERHPLVGKGGWDLASCTLVRMG